MHPSLIDIGNQRIIEALQVEGMDGIKLLGGGGAGACMLAISINEKSEGILRRVCEKYSTVILPVVCSVKGVEMYKNHEKIL